MTSYLNIVGVSAGSISEEDSDMASPNLGTVSALSNTSASDNTPLPIILGKQGEQVTTELHGQFYTQNYRGTLFYAANAAAGATYSIYSNTSYTGLALWNLSTNKNLVIVRSIIGLNGAAATAESTFGYSWVNAGYVLATAAPLSAVTEITATRGAGVCGTPGQGNSIAKVYSAATLTTALAWGRGAPVSSSTGAITTQIAIGGLVHEVGGTIIVPPGFFFALTTAIASGGTFGNTLEWYEAPV